MNSGFNSIDCNEGQRLRQAIAGERRRRDRGIQRTWYPSKSKKLGEVMLQYDTGISDSWDYWFDGNVIRVPRAAEPTVSFGTVLPFSVTLTVPMNEPPGNQALRLKSRPALRTSPWW